MVSELNPKDNTFIAASSPAHQLLMPLLYFEIFSYPLTFEEICEYCHHSKVVPEKLLHTLEHLNNLGYLYKYKDFFMTHPCPDWVREREENNKRAQIYHKRAKSMVNLIRRFPFVKAVFVSGSLSKNVMPKGGDVDYFVVTKAKRLWVARTFLILFKKIFLLNSHKYFCVNYFIDEDHLEIEEKNRFTATEIITLLPMHNAGLYNEFYEANQWVRQYYPNFPKRQTQHLKERKSKFQNFLEWFLQGRTGEWLDTFFMKKTIGYWNRKFKNFDPNQFAVALKSRRYVSKHHPQNFQDKVLKAYMDCVKSFEKRNNLKLEKVADPKV